MVPEAALILSWELIFFCTNFQYLLIPQNLSCSTCIFFFFVLKLTDWYNCLLLCLCSMGMKNVQVCSLWLILRSLSFTLTDSSMPLVVFACFSKSSAWTGSESYTFLEQRWLVTLVTASGYANKLLSFLVFTLNIVTLYVYYILGFSLTAFVF